MSDRLLLAAGLTAALAAGTGYALHRGAPWSPAPRTLTGGSTAVWQPPPRATEEQRLALAEHELGGAPVPPGFTLENKVEHHLTGSVNAATDARELKVEVTDGIDDLEEARLYVDGALKDTATRANGGIVDRPADGYATATLNAWIPPEGTSWSAAVEWDTDPGGPVRKGGFSVREPWLRGLLTRFFSG